METDELSVRPGTEITFILNNEAASPLDIAVAEVFMTWRGSWRAQLKTIRVWSWQVLSLWQPGIGSLVVTLDKPGDYQFFCTIQNHFATGMRGIVKVSN